MANPLAFSNPSKEMVPQVRNLLHRLVAANPKRTGHELRPDTATLPFLLREIDETVLPRTLRIDCEGVGTVLLTVSNRRLCAMRLEREGKPSKEVVANTPLEFAQRAMESIRSCIDNAAKVSFHCPVRLHSDPMSQISCSARLLAKQAGIEVEDTYGPTGKDIWAHLKELSLAWRLSDGETQTENCPEALLPVLDKVDTAAARMRSNRTNRTRFKAKAPQFLILPLTASHSAVLADKEKTQLVAVIRPEDTDKLAACFD